MNRENIIIEIPKDLNKEQISRAEKIMELAWKINDFIDNKFKTEYPDKYKQWHGNHCLQTSIMTCVILEMMGGLKPKVMYCIMEDKYKGETIHYNHAYVYVKDEHNSLNASYIIDMARNDRKQLFIADQVTLDEKYDNLDYSDYKDIKILAVSDINHINSVLSEIEYFTNKPSMYLLNEILMNISKVVFKFKHEGDIKND